MHLVDQRFVCEGTQNPIATGDSIASAICDIVCGYGSTNGSQSNPDRYRRHSVQAGSANNDKQRPGQKSHNPGCEEPGQSAQRPIHDTYAKSQEDGDSG